MSFSEPGAQLFTSIEPHGLENVLVPTRGKVGAMPNATVQLQGF